jgi:NAD(P)-dependent dehydrogenase (short-subunit alcohol dehydrogenase family)
MAKTAIITGGAGGMGLATARLLGADHRIVLADLDQARLNSAAAALAEDGVEAGTFVCDITDRESVAGLFREAGAGGNVRAVVHSAGVSPQMGDAAKMIRINALGTVNLATAALGVAGEGFALVNVASIAGHTPAPHPTPAVLPARTHRSRTFRRETHRDGPPRPAATPFRPGLRDQQALRHLVLPGNGRELRRQRRPDPLSLARQLRHRDGTPRRGE